MNLIYRTNPIKPINPGKHPRKHRRLASLSSLCRWLNAVPSSGHFRPVGLPVLPSATAQSASLARPPCSAGVFDAFVSSAPTRFAGLGLGLVLAVSGAQAATLTINANQLFAPTGLQVISGQTIQLSATGTIQTEVSGAAISPQGIATVAAAGAVLPGAPRYALVCRVGSGTPFLVGSGSVRSMAESGELICAVNEDGEQASFFTNNSGQWNLFAAAQSSDLLASRQVVASSPWTSLGVALYAGQKLRLAASGSVTVAAATQAGPAGTANTAAAGSVLPGAAQYGLVCRVGVGVPVFVGAASEITANDSGELMCGVNETGPSAYGDNAGAWNVTIASPGFDSGVLATLAGGFRVTDRLYAENLLDVYSGASKIASGARLDPQTVAMAADLRVVATDAAGSCHARSPLWLHYGDGLALRLDEGSLAQCEVALPEVFFDRTYLLPRGGQTLSLGIPRANGITDRSALIEWRTNVAATSVVSYGITGLGSTATIPGSLTAHSVALTGLTPSTTYQLEASSTDRSGRRVVSGRIQFTTRATPDTTPPQIIAGPSLSALSPTEAVIEWRSNEATTGAVAYGLTNALGSSIAEPAASLAHSVTLSGLNANTRYFVRVSATDLAGNGPVTSTLIDFYTPSAPDTTAPRFTQGPMILEVTDRRLQVRLTTDEASTVTVTLSDGQTTRSVSDTMLSREHTLSVDGLIPATTYGVTVGVTDALGNGPRLSATTNVTTANTADTNAPQFVSLPRACTINHQLARLCWKTDEASDAQVDYGTDPANLDQRATHSEQRTNQSLPLTGLLANTLYHYRVRAADAVGNVLQSATASFRTSTAPDTTAPVFIGAPRASYASGDRAVIEWTTDEPTQGVIEYGTTANRTLRAYDPQIKAQHQITITNLLANTPYFVRIIATDSAGNSTAADLPEPP